MSALLRIPLLISATHSFNVGVTPPNPPPAPSELVNEKWLSKLARAGPWTYAAWSTIVALCETAVFLVQSRPELPYADVILKSLMPSRAPASALRITPLFLLGWATTVAGGLVRVWCYRTLGRLFTFELTIRKDHRLVTEGPYSIVRHPSYLGLMLAFIGFHILHLSPGSWLRESGVLETTVGKCIFWSWMAFVLTMVPGVVSRMPVEDRMMKRQFGEQWEQWVQRVPYRIVPYLY
ncbi:hypothetical protein GLOTRDRAFT_117450 [Gloeophyllum trabeum ATCC 11539]|uniref:Protein-S-isoprenylcysteine O-methyltransferase n=1 Tax=Gloeophyllum trabeum (strain ATCC 11539 / FP-39264 / Madison 617) TaxID=670483 RepID=S7REQ1_GLOTA|nr:uncharacterized protein GLOTRDRAFT_117450 [Gloeophyllum trabeum ATCC 11539]EPQ52725.1 hypothetical protein GLOTRDRAFT_117450 [Gloeophyllum trabeum ATCC 11539]